MGLSRVGYSASVPPGLKVEVATANLLLTCSPRVEAGVCVCGDDSSKDTARWRRFRRGGRRGCQARIHPVPSLLALPGGLPRIILQDQGQHPQDIPGNSWRKEGSGELLAISGGNDHIPARLAAAPRAHQDARRLLPGTAGPTHQRPARPAMVAGAQEGEEGLVAQTAAGGGGIREPGRAGAGGGGWLARREGRAQHWLDAIPHAEEPACSG